MCSTGSTASRNDISFKYLFYVSLTCEIVCSMKKSSLLTTNKYLRDNDTRDKLLRQTVISSSAIEGAGAAAARALAEDKPKPKNMSKPSAVVKSA